ncbi:hypothetical protein R3P38DRAFT_1055823 [Favolaschia claudopus]|uniref:Uncharacterized protein n=1 Tax=Favolaschia claudopus TaxID=2862362 RepID=A0AAW0BGJ1_9AGAR
MVKDGSVMDIGMIQTSTIIRLSSPFFLFIPVSILLLHSDSSDVSIHSFYQHDTFVEAPMSVYKLRVVASINLLYSPTFLLQYAPTFGFPALNLFNNRHDSPCRLPEHWNTARGFVTSLVNST